MCIIDTSKNFAVERKEMPADSMLMHREQNYIAVRQFKGTQTVV